MKSHGALYSRLDIDTEDPEGHVLFSSFSRSQYDENGVPIRNQMDVFISTAPALTPMAAEISMRTIYDMVYGIFNHNEQRNRPLARVAMHPKEDRIEGSVLYRHIREYHRYGIYEISHLSLLEYLALPRHVANLLRDMRVGINEIDKEQREEFEEAEKQFTTFDSKGR